MKKIKLTTNLLPIIKPYGMVTTISDDYYDNCDNKKHTKENEVLDETKNRMINDYILEEYSKK